VEFDHLFIVAPLSFYSDADYIRYVPELSKTWASVWNYAVCRFSKNWRRGKAYLRDAEEDKDDSNSMDDANCKESLRQGRHTITFLEELGTF
jgi:hypothetical protein